MRSVFGVVVLSTACLLSGQFLKAMDLPVFYKPTLHTGSHRKNPENWVATFGVGYGQGSATRGWDTSGNKSSVLDIYGTMNITRLGLGLQSYDGKAVTGAYWNASGTGYFDYGATALAAHAGDISVQGKISSNHFDLSLEQNIVAGFFAQLSLPIRHIQVSNLAYTNLGSATFKRKDGTTDETVATFMRDVLPTMLKENNFSNGFLSGYSKTAAPEALLLFGWQGNNNQSFGIIDEASGRIQAGLIIPIAGAADQDAVFSSPLGYDEFWGMHTRFELEVGLWKIFALGAHAGLSVFMSDSRMVRLYTDCGYANLIGPLQKGCLNFEKGKVSVNKGALWDFSAYAKVHSFFGGLIGQAGLSYCRQEETVLHVKDGAILTRVIDAAAAVTPNAYYLNADSIINNDSKLGSWSHMAGSIMLGYDFKKHRNAGNLAPLFSVEYTLPFAGQRALASDYFAGSISLQTTFDF